MAEYLRYICKYMNITQNYNGRFSHYNNSHGYPKDYPIDEAGQSSGRSWMYAPCRCKVVRIYGVGSRGTNTVWLQSVNKVLLANGKLAYVTMMCIHSNDDDLRKLKVGQVFKQGDKMFREGTDGYATGNHIHMAIGLGKIKGNGWTCNSKGQWVLTTTGGALRPESAFYLDKNWNVVKSKGGLKFKTRAFTKPKTTNTSTIQKSPYYKKCANKCSTLNEGLKNIGISNSFANRSKIAKANNIKDYSGSEKQNITMLKLLKQGKLKKY